MSKQRRMPTGRELVPYYTHPAETMGESEGFGSSGRGDMVRSSSGDSCLVKNMSLHVNSDNYSIANIPIRVVSLSTMLHSERKELGARLRMELKQVQVLQKKITPLSTTQPTQSPSSDIHSCSDGKQKLEAIQRTTNTSACHVGKGGPSGRDGPDMKRGSSGRFESLRRSRPIKCVPPSTASISGLMKQCEAILKKTMSHKHSHIFNEPVNAVLLNLPDYHTIVKNPMDFSTIKSKLLSGQYPSPHDFFQDVNLTFSNALLYNPPGSDVYIMTGIVQKFFEVKWKPMERRLPPATDIESVPRSVIDLETETYAPPLKKMKPTLPDNKVNAEPVKRVMSAVEKHALSLELENLLSDLPESIVELLKANSSGAHVGEDEIEIDIDTLSDNILFQLRKLIDDYLLEKQKGENFESYKVEHGNDLESRKPLANPVKGTDLNDGVDIGGNDPLPLCFSPVVIEKDKNHGNGKLSSSSSSSSESGSSSSDSDSGSSSGNKSDGAKDSIPVDSVQNVQNPRAELNAKDRDMAELDSGRKLQEGLSEPGLQSNQPVTNWARVDGSRDGERAPSERQASPEKLYRAALLRNRFADTILKAQEKNIGKNGGVVDPEKQRIEREERERKQREEKARLRAEAHAAEAARRKLAEEAARRRREMEREAARLALQKMERTVEIGEGSRFMEEGRDGGPLEGFGFGGGSNPLEQLGLFIKADEDDEDDADPRPCRTTPPADAEEGEIHL